MGLRLKMENSERSGSDTRLKVNELAERYGEAQREITRLRSVVEERVAEAVILTEQRDVGAAALLTCEAQRTDLAQRLQQLEEQAEAQLALHESGLQELKAELAAQRGAAAEEMARLRAEVEAAQGRLRLEEDSAGNLDNYKKRAQLALKKVDFRLFSCCWWDHCIGGAKLQDFCLSFLFRRIRRMRVCPRRCSSCRPLWTRPRGDSLNRRPLPKWPWTSSLLRRMLCNYFGTLRFLQLVPNAIIMRTNNLTML